MTAASCISMKQSQQHFLIAIEQGDVAQLSALLEEDINLNIVFPNGKTPLSMAVEREALHIVKLLLAHGTDVNLPNEDGTVPLHIVTHPSVAGLLLEQGASLSVADQDGNTPLHLAKNAAVAKFLLEKGADVKAINKYSFTPIEMAVADGRVDVFEELANNWVRLTAKDLEKLRRLGKHKPAMAARLAEYQLPQRSVAKSTEAPLVSKPVNAGKARKAPTQVDARPSKPQPPIDKTCRECQGKGWRWLCASCGGTGQLFQDVPDGYGGTYRNYYPCTASCNGTGKLPCSWCDGTKIDRRFWR